MAKKSKTPPPPTPRSGARAAKTAGAQGAGGAPPPPRRPVASGGRGGRFDPRRARLLMLGGVGVVAAIVAVVLALTLGGGSSVASTLAEGGCTLFEPAESRVPIDGNVHVEGFPDGKLPEDFEYSTFPPSAGPHSGTTAIFNMFDRPLDPLNYVHNLEHGAIVVQYGDQIAAETVEQLRGWYEADSDGLIVGPLPELGDKISLAAWIAEDKYAENTSNDEDVTELVYTTSRGRLAYCSGFDEKAFSAFRDEFRGRGPERFPVTDMTRGS